VVRIALALLLACAAGSAARAQAADWSRAGGDLFVSGSTAETSRSPGAAEDAPRLGRLDQPFGDTVEAAATRHGLDPKLVHALVLVESGYRADAISPAGAGGLTQLMPATARDLGVRDRFDPADNLAAGAAFLARQILRFGDLKLALAAYNAGPERVARLGRVPRIPETQAYVADVLDCYLALAAGRRVRAARDCRATEANP